MYQYEKNHLFPHRRQYSSPIHSGVSRIWCSNDRHHHHVQVTVDKIEVPSWFNRDTGVTELPSWFSLTEDDVSTENWYDLDTEGTHTPSTFVTDTSNSEKVTDFPGLEGFEVYVDNKLIIITGYVGEATEIVIPENVVSLGENYTIVEITSNIFKDNQTIQKLTIEDGANPEIGDYAFANCSNLKKVIMPESMKNLGTSIFSGCEALTSAGEIGSGADYEFGWTTEIPNYAFSGLSGLIEINLPDSIETIGNGAFSSCVSLEEILLPDSVTILSSSLFNGCTSLKNIRFSNALETVGMYAFSGCTNLREIDLPDTVTYIYAYAFQNCSNLEKINIPASVLTWIGADFTHSTHRSIFTGCTKLLTAGGVESGADIEFAWETKIPSYGLLGTGVRKVVIPEGIVSVESSALASNTNLTAVLLPESIETISTSAFSSCTSLRNLYYAGTETQWSLVDGNEYLNENYVINFNWSGSLPEITSGFLYLEQDDYILIIGYEGSGGNIAIPSTLNGLPVKAIGESAFQNNTSITKVSFPDTLTSIGSYAFAGAIALKEVAVYGTNSIQIFSVSGTDELGMTIGKNAFEGCRELTSVVIPEGIVAIEEDVFSDCPALEEIYIPLSVASIEDMGLENVETLTINYTGSEEDWKAITINDESLEDAEILYDSEVELEPEPEENEESDDGLESKPEDETTPDNSGDTSGDSGDSSDGNNSNGNNSNDNSSNNDNSSDNNSGNDNSSDNDSGGSSSDNSSSDDNTSEDDTSDLVDEETDSETQEESSQDVIIRELPVIRTMNTSTFFDMTDPSQWYYEPVKFVYERGLMTGTSTNKFSPETTTSRGMIVQVLYNIAGSPSVSGRNYADISTSDWYSDAVSWASSVGVATGVSPNYFNPEGDMTREELCVMLYAYEKLLNGSYYGDQTLRFNDTDSINSWATEAVTWCFALGIVIGEPNGTFYPQGSAKRCEVAQILKNFVEIYS